MIEELHIRGLGVIEDATLPLAAGLTVVTGETGAGKTMVVTALELLLGARSDVGLVRAGAGEALVEAALGSVPDEAAEWLDPDFDPDRDVLVVSRVIPPDGRSRARVGGRLAPVSALADILGRHVEVHAQHEHVRLSRPDVQRDLLDRYAGDEHLALAGRVRDAHRVVAELRARRDELDQGAAARTAEVRRLRAEVEQIEAARLDLERDGAIDDELAVLANAEEVRTAMALAADALGGDGALDALGRAVDALRRLDVVEPRLDELRARLAATAAEAAELAADVRRYGEQVDLDPDRLASLQERKHLLSGLMRAYGAGIEEVVAHGEHAARRLRELEADEDDASALDGELHAAEDALAALAGELSAGRRVAGQQLAADVAVHLADLGMPHAALEVVVEPRGDDAIGASGGDRVELLLAPNPGEAARPLGRAASGGERSRVSLAMEVALADADDVRVLVFDEVDAGVGGATALAVGEKLARLATSTGAGPARQVLCVTHLAQLAAFADVHHVVEKSVVDGRTVTTSRRIAEDERVAELARMLGGDPDGTAARDHARALLEQARARVPR